MNFPRPQAEHGSIDREIARLALPAFATLLAEPLYVLSDTAIVGHLGTVDLAGLALASTVLLAGYAAFVFLAYGTTAGVARLLGAARRDAAAEQAVQSIWLAVVIALVVSTVGLVFGRDLLAALGGEGGVLAAAWIYLSISLPGVPALLIGLAGTGYLRGLQNTRTPLVVTVVGVALNLGLEVILILGFGRGIGASALASVVAQWVVALFYLFGIAADVRTQGVSLAPKPAAMAHQLRVGGDLLVRTVALRAALVVATMVAASLGAVALAAHQIAFELWNFLALIVDSLAIAAQALVGRLLGEGDSAGARAVGRRVLVWSLRLGTVLALAVVASSRILPRVFSGDPRVLSLAATLLLVVGLSQPVNAVAFGLDGILIGAGDTRFLAWSMLLASAFFIALAQFVRLSGLTLIWLWWALAALMITRAALLGLRFAGDSWARTGSA